MLHVLDLQPRSWLQGVACDEEIRRSAFFVHQTPNHAISGGEQDFPGRSSDIIPLLNREIIFSHNIFQLEVSSQLLSFEASNGMWPPSRDSQFGPVSKLYSVEINDKISDITGQRRCNLLRVGPSSADMYLP